MAAQQKEQLLKVLVVGECGTGKTCLIRYYMHQSFQSTNKATIGVDFALKVLPESNTTLQIWDIAGQERYGQMTRVYFLSAVGAMVVCEINKPETYAAAINWKKDVDSKAFLPGTAQTPIPCVLLLNKCDLDDSHMSDEQLDEFCKQHGFVAWYKVSAKNGDNVSTAFESLVDHVQEARAKARAGAGEEAERKDQNKTVQLGKRSAPKKKSEDTGGCCKK
uniref:Ras-related protein Rab n=1 Tax=Neobodo designis TaxID=312471 RepID=A0A7S1QCP4_NEODS|mmetsp:Transcript_41460/g.128110  ORF Transcript_41460/g.128110 Transcript_41460/m.128110 type:complete len:220 (+) Transcript_41460:93-752(+)|eukprot:CAMPEP_0174835612 /NCGR_PEP_ID=MMETSP1114-20130205/5496_1 /TAXON_ID=312471 /ORGANISM="Neobodo designis, Strain CCAP 1951/1" /LENGTH=219 /DNA_ID=CAMNT_0016069565 /DNA_START=93 /DNA_END=752 /DNA_ORIENTATION=-